MSSTPDIVVTAALPYANGHLHLGNLLEHIQTNIWVRAHKMLGISCVSICGDDAHGTPIMLKAERLGISPEALTQEMQKSHKADLKAFDIDYDYYHSTHSEENRLLVNVIYQRLRSNGDIIEEVVRQAYDPVKNIFLPDRYVKGECPKCHAKEQYGDNCEVCGAAYAATDLINPVSVLSQTKPIEKDSLHYFFDLPRYEGLLKEWTRQGHLQSEVVNKLDEWFAAGLKRWDISRDAPYFGFPIPDAQDKYFYVWLDAPVGYMASFKKYCELNDVSFDAVWAKGSQSKLYHFVGKDIVYFHALFWPAMLEGSGFRMPSAIFTHGYLTVEKQKMSKSRGTFLEVSTYLNHLEPEYLRYYFAAKLNGRVDDLDLNFDDFINRVNADLVGKVVNIASRSAGFIAKYFDNTLSKELAEPDLYAEILEKKDAIMQAYIDRDYARAIRLIMENADRINQYIDSKKPWILAKDEANLPEVHTVCSMGIELFRLLIIYLKPVLPALAHKVETFLRSDALTWVSLETPLLDHTISNFIPLMQRVERQKIDAMLAEAKNIGNT